MLSKFINLKTDDPDLRRQSITRLVVLIIVCVALVVVVFKITASELEKSRINNTVIDYCEQRGLENISLHWTDSTILNNPDDEILSQHTYLVLALSCDNFSELSAREMQDFFTELSGAVVDTSDTYWLMDFDINVSSDSHLYSKEVTGEVMCDGEEYIASDSEPQTSDEPDESMTFDELAELCGSQIYDTGYGSAMDYMVSDESLWLMYTMDGTRNEMLRYLATSDGAAAQEALITAWSGTAQTVKDLFDEHGFTDKHCMVEISLSDGTLLLTLIDGDVSFDLSDEL